MRSITTIILLTILQAAWGPVLRAQYNPEKVREVLQKVQQAYKSASCLSFTVQYAYANMDKPDNAIDTLTGEVEMDKVRSHVILSGTETVVTDRYSIQVLPQDKLLYVSSAPAASVMDPVGGIDSVLTYLDKFQTDLTEDAGNQVLTIRFPQGGRFSQVRMTVDGKTGYLQEMIYEMSTAGMVSRGGSYQAQGRISIRFSDYRKGAFKESVFDVNNYFTQVNGQFLPGKSYKDYHIFWAQSPH